jgi:hypothetical protein
VLPGETDAELAEELGISISTVKNKWRSIYDRVAACLRELFPDCSDVEPQISDRGTEKQHRLLAYLREHPEELRLVSQKLLREEANLRDGTSAQRNS